MQKLEVLHVIPQIGPQHVRLFPPADFVYRQLQQLHEVERLEKLLHLGALYNAFPGVRQARWDYTMAMVYYAGQLKVPGMGTRPKFGNVEFSSVNAALQTLALVWNVGHLPGTFDVEKGVLRFLYERNPDNLVGNLPWPTTQSELVEDLRKKSEAFLSKTDYRGLARVLAVIKLLNLCDAAGDDDLAALVCDFAAPALLQASIEPQTQWLKLRTAFSIVRHLAYLTLDAPFTGLKWSPGIPEFVRQTMENDPTDLSEVNRRVSEILSPFERAMYESIYHSTAGRKEGATVATSVFRTLQDHLEPSREISRWMTCSTLGELAFNETAKPQAMHEVATVRLRSHFITIDESPVALERGLQQRGFTHSVALVYNAWRSGVLIEPDETVVNIVTEETPTLRDIGKAILWIMSEFDKFEVDHKELAAVMTKLDLEVSYLAVLARAVELSWPGWGWSLRVTPWPLCEFGLFPSVSIPTERGGVWACDARLNDRLIKYILRDRSRAIPGPLRDRYAELAGLKELRSWLRGRWTDRKELRQRWLAVTGSVQMWRKAQCRMEFDGGLLRISTRSGSCTLYLLLILT